MAQDFLYKQLLISKMEKLILTETYYLKWNKIYSCNTIRGNIQSVNSSASGQLAFQHEYEKNRNKWFFLLIHFIQSQKWYIIHLNKNIKWSFKFLSSLWYRIYEYSKKMINDKYFLFYEIHQQKIFFSFNFNNYIYYLTIFCLFICILQSVLIHE